ncbi:MAG: hypothetical protein F6K30_07650 [Cyanothece sp. SIO2G6]|nr:hypothetical protein [Cyanothece sp. SIO2G6]
MAIPKIDGLSCSFLLAYPLAWVTSKWLQTIPVEWEPHGPKFILQTVIRQSVLKRSPTVMPLTYQSAIALKLAHQWHQPITRVAYQLCAEFTALITQPQVLRSFQTWLLDHGTTAAAAHITVALLQDITINPLANGHLQIQLSPPALATWLQWLLTSTFLDETHYCHQTTFHQRVDYPLSDLPFVLLQVHARCCTILCLAHHRGYINLKAGSQSCSHRFSHQSSETDEMARRLGQSNILPSPLWTIGAPTPIPWEAMFETSRFESSRSESSRLQTADPHRLLAVSQPLPIRLCLYLNQIIETIERLERIGLSDFFPGSVKILEKILDEKNDPPATLLSQKARQQLINLSQQFQHFEKYWSAQSWNAKASDLPLLPSPMRLSYLGLVCITQRALHFPFIMADASVSLPHEL